MKMRLMKQLQNGLDPEKLNEIAWSDLTDEIDDVYTKLHFLKTGLETTLTNLTTIYRDLKRAGQNLPAIEVHAEMAFVGRLIAVIDVMLLDEALFVDLEEVAGS